MLEDVRFLLGQPDLFALGIEQQLGARAERIGADAIDGFLALFVAAEMGMDACRQNRETEWLGHVVIGPGLKSFDDIGVGIMRSQKNDGAGDALFAKFAT